MIRPSATAILLFVVLREACATQPLFVREEVYSTPTGTFGLAAGDFDGDGWLDLAATNQSSEFNGYLGLTAYHNQNGMGFNNRTDYLTGYRPFGITSGDFNGDHLADVAIATYYSQTVTVRYAQAGGGFSSPTDYQVNGEPFDVVTGDFNHDGLLDLATNHYTFSVLSGLTAGGFGSPHLVNTGSSGYGNLLAVDLNHDGRLDLAQTTGGGSSVQVFWGQAGGTFGPSDQYPAGPTADALAAGDLNGDGLLDLAITNWQSRKITTLFGELAGGFGEAHTYDLGVTPIALAIADFNADGHADLAVSQIDNGSGLLTIFLGQVNGLLTMASSTPIHGTGKDIVVADFNRDGGLDLALTASGPNTNYSSFSVFYNSVPEPSSMVLLLLAMPVLFYSRTTHTTRQTMDAMWRKRRSMAFD
jgi:hypothetical protein